MDPARSPQPSGSVRAVVFVLSIVVGVLWVVVKHRFEGPVEVELTTEHGIHRYDFLALVPPTIALVWWARAR